VAKKAFGKKSVKYKENWKVRMIYLEDVGNDL
jgi:hypothetical protein